MTQSDLSARVAGLSPEKQALLARKLAERQRMRGGVETTIPRRADRTQAPLSEAQESLWLYEQMFPKTSAYNVPLARRLRGHIDVPLLEQAIASVVARHESLRTSIVEANGSATQIVSAHVAVPVRVIDLSRHSPAERTQAESEALRTVATDPFDLNSGPLFRAALITHGESEHLLVLVVHHIVVDGASISILLREIGEAYSALIEGREPARAEPPVHLGDVAAWERTTAGDTRGNDIDFWRRYLDGAPRGIDLPTDHPRTGNRSGPAGRVASTLPRHIRSAVDTLARQTGSTPFMVLLSGFEALLYRYSGQRDFTVGIPVAGRSREETVGVIGYLASTVVMRARFDGNPTFAELVARSKADTAQVFSHQALPAERLARELGGSHSAVGLFDVMFVLQSAEPNTLVLGSATVEAIPAAIGTAKFDMTFLVTETEDGLRVAIEFRRDLFDEPTMQDIIDHYGELLLSGCAAPNTPVSHLALLTPPERSLVLSKWQGEHLPFDEHATMASLFELQAASTPEAPALVVGNTVLTYAELEARSGHLAKYLRSVGVGRGVRAAICAERSEHLVIGLLAILRAGGAYIPLDPNYPAQRIQGILDDSRPAVVLVDTPTVARVTDMLAAGDHTHRAVVIALDAPVPAAEHAIESPESRDLAYVIYTSGSTGRPKGVAIAHRSVVAFITWAQTLFGHEELRAVIASTSICFDLSVFELFVTLSSGGAVILVENALAVAELQAPVSPSLLNTVPSAIAALLRMNGVPRSICTVNLAGEPLQQRIVDELYTRGHVKHVYDLYGPSEDTTYSTFVLRQAGGRASIGRPIANTQAYVVDSALQLVPVGVPGELYLGGEGLALGYLDRPDFTAERFVENPFASEVGLPKGNRLYRTGDLVRWNREGNLEYLGRLDYQVKLRGFRIELGEVELALRAVEGVEDAVAVVREDAPGDPRLVAYIATRGGSATPSVSALKDALARRLPVYMVPSAIVPLAELPLTPNGKVDRKMLPAPVSDGDTPVGVITPRNELEQVVAGVWKEVLGTSAHGVNQDFFELGGHSLLATRIVGQLARIFRVSMPIRQFFETPTVAGNAAALTALERKPGQATTIARLFLKAQNLSGDRRPEQTNTA